MLEGAKKGILTHGKTTILEVDGLVLHEIDILFQLVQDSNEILRDLVRQN
jgi:hypothetical protein